MAVPWNSASNRPATPRVASKKPRKPRKRIGKPKLPDGSSVWRVPSQAHYGLGAEIVEIEYELSSGKRATHIPSAVQSEWASDGDIANFYALLSKTLAGRLWLMLGPKGDSLYIATDRIPRSSLWIEDKIDPLHAVLSGESVTEPLTGLVV